MSINYSGHWRRMLACLTLVLLGATATMAQWTSMTPLAEQANFGMQAYLNGKLYTFGGSGGSTFTMMGQSLDVNTPGAAWTPTVSLPTPRVGGYAAAVNGKIYLLGGYYTFIQGQTQYTALNDTILEYNPATNTLTAKGRLPVGTRYAAGAVVDNKIYLIGGQIINGNQLVASNVVQVYDPATGVATQLEGAPWVSYFGSATAVGNEIYAVGGISATAYLASAYKGTVSGNSIIWGAIANYPVAIFRHAGGTINGKPVFAGGAAVLPPNNIVPTQNSYSYDASSDSWSPSYYLPKITYNVVNMPGDGSSIYYVGGYDNANVYKLTADSDEPAASVGRTSFLLTAVKGTSKSLTTTVTNLGLRALTVNAVVPPSAPWLTVTPANSTLTAPQGTTFTAPATQQLTFTFNTAALEPGSYKTTVTLNTNDPKNPSIAVNVNLFVVTAMGTQLVNAVIEEATGTWCQFCPEGYAVLNQIEATHGERSIILSHHQGDNMQLSNGLELLGKFKTNSYPSASIQRMMWPNEAALMTNRGQWDDHAASVINDIRTAPVSLVIEEYAFDEATRRIVATVKATVHEAIPVGTLRLSTMVSQDGIVADQQDQNGQILRNYVHKHVVRGIKDVDGTPFTIDPANIVDDLYISPGTEATMQVTWSVPPALSGAPAYDFTKMHVVFIAHGFDKGVPTNVYQGLERDLKGGPVIEPTDLLEVTSDVNHREIASEQEAVFTATVRNLTSSAREVQIIRTTNNIPAGWNSRICAFDGGNVCSEPGTSTETILLGPNGSAVVKLKVTSGATTANGSVVLNFSTNDGEYMIPQTYTVNSTQTVGVDEEITAGASLSLSQIFPNPVSDAASLEYGLATAGKARIEVYSVEGVKVATLVDGHKPAGTHRLEFSAAGLKSGTYNVVLTVGGRTVSRKLTVVH